MTEGLPPATAAAFAVVDEAPEALGEEAVAVTEGDPAGSLPSLLPEPVNKSERRSRRGWRITNERWGITVRIYGHVNQCIFN